MTEINDAVELGEKRHRFRRSSDIKLLAAVIVLGSTVFTGGIAWATANRTVSEKLDKSAFRLHADSVDRRFLVDSLEAAFNKEALARIESKVDAVDGRLSRFICDRQPAYCK